MYKAKLEVCMKMGDTDIRPDTTSRLTAQFTFDTEVVPEDKKEVRKRMEFGRTSLPQLFGEIGLVKAAERGLSWNLSDYLYSVEGLEWNHLMRMYEKDCTPQKFVKVRRHWRGLGLTVSVEQYGEHSIDELLNLKSLDHYVRTGEYPKPEGGKDVQG